MDKNSGFRILVVEDEPLLRWSVAQALEASGNTVIEAADGSSAMWAIKHLPAADVVLLDYRLPDSDGFSLLEDIRHLAPDTPVVMMTAYGTEEIRDRAKTLGVSGVLSKPFDVFSVDDVLKTACVAHPH